MSGQWAPEGFLLVFAYWLNYNCCYDFSQFQSVFMTWLLKRGIWRFGRPYRPVI